MRRVEVPSGNVTSVVWPSANPSAVVTAHVPSAQTMADRPSDVSSVFGGAGEAEAPVGPLVVVGAAAVLDAARTLADEDGNVPPVVAVSTLLTLLAPSEMTELRGSDDSNCTRPKARAIAATPVNTKNPRPTAVVVGISVTVLAASSDGCLQSRSWGGVGAAGYSASRSSSRWSPQSSRLSTTIHPSDGSR